MYRLDKKPGWLLSVSLRLLFVALLIQLAACGGSGGSKTLVVSSITPTTVPATGGQVSFSGNNFSSDDQVTIGGVSAKVFYGGPTLLTANAPASNTPGAVDVVVSSASGGTVTLHNALTYDVPQTPVVSSAPICTGAVCTYQAENPQSTLTGNADIAACSGCSGGVKVGNLGGTGYVTINDISASATGTYNLTIYGVDGDGVGSSGRNLTVAVNGAAVSQTVPIVGPSWGATSPGQTIQVQLNQGSSNSIQFGNSGDYAPDLDYIVVSPQHAGGRAGLHQRHLRLQR